MFYTSSRFLSQTNLFQEKSNKNSPWEIPQRIKTTELRWKLPESRVSPSFLCCRTTFSAPPTTVVRIMAATVERTALVLFSLARMGQKCSVSVEAIKTTTNHSSWNLLFLLESLFLTLHALIAFAITHTTLARSINHQK